jgi:hypothetical protein
MPQPLQWQIAEDMLHLTVPAAIADLRMVRATAGGGETRTVALAPARIAGRWPPIWAGTT